MRILDHRWAVNTYPNTEIVFLEEARPPVTDKSRIGLDAVDDCFLLAVQLLDTEDMFIKIHSGQERLSAVPCEVNIVVLHKLNRFFDQIRDSLSAHWIRAGLV